MIAPTPPGWWDGFITGNLFAVAWGGVVAFIVYARRRQRQLRDMAHEWNRIQAEKRERES